MSRVYFSGLVVVVALACSLRAEAQSYTYIAPEMEVAYIGVPSTLAVEVGFQIWSNGNPTANTQGFSMGVSHDTTALDVIAVDHAFPTTPDFFSENIVTNGWTVGAVYSFLGSTVYQFPDPTDVAIVTYQTEPGYLAANPSGEVELVFSNTLGSPPVNNTVVVSGASQLVTLQDGSLTFTSAEFSRGDVNSDTVFDISDAVAALASLFIPGSDAPACLDAADANDDGMFDVSDPVTMLASLFIIGTDPLPEPSDCGADPTADDLTCDVGCP